MDERFVSLAALVMRPTSQIPAPPIAAGVAVVSPIRGEAAPPEQGEALDDSRADCARDEVVRELRLVRLAAIEAFERTSVAMLETLARDVLAREAMLAPADLAALAARARAALADQEPLTLVVAPSECATFACDVPTRVDATLEPGDLLVEVRDGSLESRFAFRVRAAVATAFAGP